MARGGRGADDDGVERPEPDVGTRVVRGTAREAADVEACKTEGVVLEATIFDHDDISASDRLGGVVVTAADVLRVAEEGGEVDLVLQGVKGKKMGKSMLKLGFKMQQHA